jgi:methanogenic corrinoid protein MtbC1
MDDDHLAEPRLAVLAALHQGDAGLAARIVLDLMGQGYPLTTILEEVVAPMQHESGRRWQVGDYSISDEHVATAAAEVLLSTLAGAFDQPEGAPHVVVGCATGELHTLPARMAAALLLAEGYRCTFLGSSVPAEDLEAYLAAVRPAAVVVTCTLVGNLLGAREVVDAAHRAEIPVIAGGRAFGTTGARASAVGADAWAPSLLALVDLLASGPPALGAVEGSVPAGAAAGSVVAGGELGARRAPAIATLAGGWTDRLGQPPTPTVARVVSEEAGRLFDALVVAVQLHDPGLLREQADWLAAYLPTIGVAGATAHDLLAELARAVGDDDPAVGPLIADAAAA